MASLRKRARRSANLRYGGEERALGALMQEAEQDYRTDRRVANATSRAAAAAARASRRPIRKAYRQAQTQADVARQDVNASFGGLSAAADPFKAVTEREFALEKQRTAGEAAEARSDAIARERDAKVGRVFALGAAKQRHNAAIADLLAQASALRSEKGEYAASQLDEYLAARDQQDFEAEQNRLDRKSARENTLLNQGRDPKTGEPLDKPNKSGREKFDPADRAQLRMFQDDFAVANQWIAKLREVKATKNNPKTGTKKGDKPFDNPEKLQEILTSGNNDLGVPKVDDQLAIKAALDMAYKKYVTPQTWDRLYAAGFRVADLPGAMSAKKYRKLHSNPLGVPNLGSVFEGPF